jgi:NAD(P)-dependent dehydrogenase (short-subunit alcohol dehydrogenase family)|tara:strand:+ start:1973 stop:2779 length:807 start_codon:yes stop_codon:yes gene_type:complete
MNAKDLEGLTAIVTGSAQGLGLGIARELASRGAAVVVADLQLDKAEVECEKMRAAGWAATAAELNITDSAAVNAFFAGFDRLDILVNNAGTGQQVAPISELPDAEWHRVMDATLTGAFYCCRAAAEIMERQESGSIVNISSINGQNPAALVAAYNVAKAGVISLTRTLALELAAYGVRVNAVCPGPVYTDFNKRNMAQRCETLGIGEEEMIERIRSAIPLGRWGEPEDIARGVAFLCSPQAEWVTGEIMRVSGGMEGVSATPPKRPRK